MGGREDWAALAGSLTITASIQLNWLAWRCPILQVGYTYHSAETFSEKHSCAGCNPRSDSVTILNRQTGCPVWLLVCRWPGPAGGDHTARN